MAVTTTTGEAEAAATGAPTRTGRNEAAAATMVVCAGAAVTAATAEATAPATIGSERWQRRSQYHRRHNRRYRQHQKYALHTQPPFVWVVGCTTGSVHLAKVSI